MDWCLYFWLAGVCSRVSCPRPVFQQVKGLPSHYGANSPRKTQHRDLWRRWSWKYSQCYVVERCDAFIIHASFYKQGIKGHAAEFAGTHHTEGTEIARTTSAGLVPEGAVAGSGSAVVSSGQDGTPPAVPPPRPFYKKRWFIISQIIIIPLGIALLFILLFPVVRAIVQLVVNKSTLDIQVATISGPRNNTSVLVLFLLGGSPSLYGFGSVVLHSRCKEMYFVSALTFMYHPWTFSCRSHILAKSLPKSNFQIPFMYPGWKMVVWRHHWGPWPLQTCQQSILERILIKLRHSSLQMKMPSVVFQCTWSPLGISHGACKAQLCEFKHLNFRSPRESLSIRS